MTVSARATRRRPQPTSGEDSERFEVCRLGPRSGRRRVRVVATASTLGGALLAVESLVEENGVDAATLVIRDAETGRWIGV